MRRYRDEDGECFIEVPGEGHFLYRVDENGQVCYKIERSMLEGEDLTLVDDYTKIRRPPPGVIEPLHPVELQADIFSDEEPILEGSQGVTAGTAPTLTASQSGAAGAPLRKELEEGVRIPSELIPLCQKNDYGGYTLRYNRFLYVLDGQYRVDLKTPDASLNFNFEDDTVPMMVMSPKPAHPGSAAPGGLHRHFSPPRETEFPQTAPPPLLSIPDAPAPQTFKKDDIIPPELRALCEESLGPGGGSRLIHCGFLYLLDSDYRVLTRMKVSVLGEAPPMSSPSEFPSPADMRTPLPLKKQLSIREVVDNVSKAVKIGLQKWNIKADYFVENVLTPSHRETLIRAYKGDLSLLNDDTREATEQGNHTVLEEMGYSLFRAALLHELYIKSTLAGRGDNMKFFITHLLLTCQDGSPAAPGETPGFQDQQKMLEFLGSRAHVYPDKGDLIKHLYRNLRLSVFDEFAELIDAGKNVKFNAFLIMKLYQQTTRLDRGDGITMIRLSRDLMDYRPEV